MNTLFSRQPPAKPELWAFWMRSYDFIGNAIAAVTDGQWSHAGVLVFLPDGTAWVYEALFGEGKVVRQDAKKRFISFLKDNPDGQLCCVPITWATDEAIASAIAYGDSCVKDVTYAKWQLLAMLRLQRWGWPVPRSSTKQVCSELQARMLGGSDSETAIPRICDLRDSRHKIYDAVAPDHSFRRMMAIVAGFGDYTHNPPVQNHPAIP